MTYSITFQFERIDDEMPRALLAMAELEGEEPVLSFSGIDMWGFIVDMMDNALPAYIHMIQSIDQLQKMEHLEINFRKMANILEEELEKREDEEA